MPGNSTPADTGHQSHQQEILAAQVRLLYANRNMAAGVTLLAAAVLASLEWSRVSHVVVWGWWLYTLVIAGLRYALALRFHRVTQPDIRRWQVWFAVGAGLAGAGWGAGGFLLYPPAHLTHQVFLGFVLGGMMLGAAALLAPRPEAFLAFLIPTGLAPTVRLLMEGDETHIAMGVLAGVFSLATLVMTSRIYHTVDSSLRLQFENQDLLDDLKAAKEQTQALNQALERRVEERTSELQKSTEQLRAEIAQRMQVEEELLQARKLESMGVLAGGIAHDFNNFLTIVQGNLELAGVMLADGEPVQEVLDDTLGACKRAAFLSAQLLTFAKGGSPVRRVISLGDVVRDAVALARAGTGISVDLNIADELPPVEADPVQLGQVLQNILLNARQAMPEGGIIEIRAEKIAESVRISIRDYGCGIPEDVLPRVFDPYFTTRPGCSGLGLATAYAIVAKHGGHILLESKPGHGTTVLIDLPASSKSVKPQETLEAAILSHRGHERLLVMDDEEALRKLLDAVLTNLGYQVQTARDGAEAIALYEQAKAAGKPFDAVLLDLTVSGGMGGVEAAAKLKEVDPACKLIVSSGYAGAPVMSDFRPYGFEEVIPKPWTVAELGSVFRRVLVKDRDRERQ